MTSAVIQRPPRGLFGEIRALMQVSLPIMVAQGGLTAMGLVDTFMVGQVSAVEMGGVALGNIISLMFAVFGLGLKMGIEPLVAQAYGAGEIHRAYRWYQQGIWTAVWASLPVMGLTAASIALLPHLGASEAVVAAASAYVWFRLPSIAANGLYGAARSYLTSMQRTRPVVIAVVSANVLNVGLDYVLVIVAGLGAAGVGIATTICWTLMFVVVGVAVHLDRPPGTGFAGRPSWREQLEIFRIGWPIGLQFVAEVGIFNLVGLLIARMGDVPLGGHQIAITLASLTFMSAVGIAVGATALVGHHVGAGQSGDARRVGLLSIAVGAVFMGSAGLVFYLLGTPLARLFAPTDEAVVVIGAQLLQVAALFSVSDGIQAVSAGALRGVGDTKWSFYANTGAHWFVGLPVGLYLAYSAGFGVRGLWYGLTIGLTGVAIVLTVRFLLLTRGDLQRVEAPAPKTAS